MNKKDFAFAAVLTLTMTLAAGANALPFQNGSFEDPGIGSGNFLNLNNTPTQRCYITGWEVFYGDIDYAYAWSASDGDYSIDLNGTTAGGIYMKLLSTTTPMAESHSAAAHSRILNFTFHPLDCRGWTMGVLSVAYP
ncbi:hypothetical protein [Desulfofustis glycolicus]|uniref:hypothetical protein n=1 Tax=Desulfofustis glycolicus TaxID=51195 RepID=UPI000934154F|nr:hypothetical protein [Desulfofustis glycolicus]MCB2214834.1 hypothetical protein [Desulfobulbaceae bacterium]